MKPVIDYSLYLVTDRHYLKGRDFYTCPGECLKGWHYPGSAEREKLRTRQNFWLLATRFWLCAISTGCLF